MGEHHPIRPFGLDQGCMRLLRDGYLVLENALPRPTLSALDQDLARDFEETPFCTGGFYGGRTKRFGRLLARSAHSDRLVRHPLVLAIAETVLAPWCERIQLNLTQAIAIHPGAPPQLPHRDQDMWRGPTGEIEYLVNVMWPLTPFTTENGATCLWPDSHGSRAGLVGPENQDTRPK
jgi:ectoine hydroxylase-related dioxygenase (phytanoyl-CoA dioxygenase family)